MSLRNTIGRQGNIVEIRAPGLKGDAGALWRGEWLTATVYNVNDLIRYTNGNIYICVSSHTSTTDLTPIVFTLTDTTPSITEGTLSDNWTGSATHTDVEQTAASVTNGAGLKVGIATSADATPVVTITLPDNVGTGDAGKGSGYDNADTLVFTEPTSSKTATVTLSSNWQIFTGGEDAESWANRARHNKFTDLSTGTSGYSSKHSALQAFDWASKTTGFVPKDTRSQADDGDPNIGSNIITFTQPHGFTVTSPFTEIRFRMVVNTVLGRTALTSLVLPTGLTAQDPSAAAGHYTKIQSIPYYVKTVPSTTTMTLSATSSGGTATISAGTGTLVIQDEFSAKSWAIGGTDVTTTANRGSSKDWATKDDGAVDTVEHSSKAWAVGGTGITTTASHGSSKDWATKANGGVDGGTAVNSYSALAWAVGGTGITTTASRGAAKEWATTTGGAVDTSEFSAKEYAQGTAASTGGSSKSWAQDVDQVNGAGTNDRSAKNWSQGASMTGGTLGGSAKDWASLAEDSQVNASEYSAKHYSAKAQASQLAATASAAAVGAVFDSFDDKYLGVMQDRVFTASSDSGLKITSTAHGLAANDVIRVTSSAGSPDLPVNLSVDTNYFVLAGGLTANEFYLATAAGGGIIAFSDAGTGTHTWYYGTSLTAGITGTWAQDSSVIAVSNVSGIRVGQEVVGSGIEVDANVIAISGSNITISENMAAAGSGVAVVFTSHGVLGAYNLTKDGPGLDNDGNALTAGLLHFNDTDSEMRVYSVSQAKWISASSAANVTILEFQYTVGTDAGAPVGSVVSNAGIDQNGATLAFSSAESVQVYLNGVLQLPNILDGAANDYTLTANTVTFASALIAGDVVNVQVYKTFTVADMVPASTGGTFSGDITAPNQATTGKAIAMALVFGS